MIILMVDRTMPGLPWERFKERRSITLRYARLLFGYLLVAWFVFGKSIENIGLSPLVSFGQSVYEFVCQMIVYMH